MRKNKKERRERRKEGKKERKKKETSKVTPALSLRIELPNLKRSCNLVFDSFLKSVTKQHKHKVGLVWFLPVSSAD